MEAHESQQPTGDGKKRGKNIVWSKEMDKCLILELVHQANEGYKVDKGFKDQAYVVACSSLNSSFNLFFSREHCVNRLKTIKKKFRLVQEMLSKSGLSWNPMTKMVECSDQVWTTYVAANPDAKRLRGKKIEMLDELSIVCGNDQATGEWACSGKDVNANYSKKTNDSEDEYSHLFDPIDNMRNYRSSKTVTEQSKKSKGAELVAETMVAVATNMVRLADAYEKSKPCIDYLELYKAVMDVEELDINSRMTAFEYLNGDPITARAFLIYPQDMHYLFLIRQLSQGGPDGI
ncbi:L10-interacting MYB domain-containing protein [Camellia lanceoleosa]|uniref:L10-interacting MYB domain-containing protein n=1 Tax=Camellia lanceoleosa TaxID=1840588 RepID=A0ACC0H4I9_9ERIC|nr:L10-interacting MYB domain-containing protein [Camellia lanceoleosa]